MISIIHDNKNFVVCEKPSGYISEISEKADVSLPLILSKQLGNITLYTVHRLDREVSGLIVYAKNKETAAELSKQITNADFKKEYITTVNKRPEFECKLLCDLLFHDRSKNKTYIVKRQRNGVKKARLEYKLISHNQDKDVSTLRIKLYTGRTHQIRVQLANIGIPIYGDKKYGSTTNSKHILLHAFSLSFYDPGTKDVQKYISFPEWLEESDKQILSSDIF